MGSKAESKILILEYESILIHRDTYCYVVSELNSVSASSSFLQHTDRVYSIGSRPTYHTSLLTAAQEVSDRLLIRRLRARAEALRSDLDSLKEVVNDHYKKMEEFYAQIT